MIAIFEELWEKLFSLKISTIIMFEWNNTIYKYNFYELVSPTYELSTIITIHSIFRDILLSRNETTKILIDEAHTLAYTLHVKYQYLNALKS